MLARSPRSVPALSPRPALALLLALLAALAAALAAAGCGSTGATLDPVAQAAEATTQAGGAHIVISGKIGSPQLPGAITISGEGTFNASRQEGQIAFDASGLPSAMRQQLPGGRLTITELYTHGAIYMRSAILKGRLPGGATWLKIDIAKAFGVDPQTLASGQSDPTQMLKYLRGSGASITKLGTEAIRGTPTTHYRGTVDLQREAETLPGKDRTAMRSAVLKMIAKSGTRTLPIELWIDDHHLMRKMTTELASGVARMRMTTEMFDFGTTPSVSVPPSSEVYDATHIALGGLTG